VKYKPFPTLWHCTSSNRVLHTVPSWNLPRRFFRRRKYFRSILWRNKVSRETTKSADETFRLETPFRGTGITQII